VLARSSKTNASFTARVQLAAKKPIHRFRPFLAAVPRDEPTYRNVVSPSM
jgi:hypothetical protein